MMPTLIEAALRSLLLALAVWVGLRAFRVRNVLAQKTAWGLVLASAVCMPLLAPLVARWQPSPALAALTLPSDSIATLKNLIAPAEKTDRAINTAIRRVAITPDPQEKPIKASTRLVTVAKESGVESTSSVSQSVYLASTSVPESTVISHVYNGEPVSSTPVPPVRIRSGVSVASIAMLLYISVAAALFLRVLFGLGSALRLWRSAAPIVLEEFPFSGLPIRSSGKIPSPVTIGSGIVLPANYPDWDIEKLRIVLAHERSHIRQGDFYLQLLAELYAALVWFSPLGWWLKRTLSDLAETISDRAGLLQAASGTSYAQILLEFAEAPRPTPIGVAMAREGSLSRRIERLLNDSAFRQAFAGGRRRFLIAVLLVPVALFAATALVRVQAAQDTQAAPAPAAQPAPPAQIASPRTGVANPGPSSEPTSETESSTIVVHTNGPVAPEAVGPVAPMPPLPEAEVIRIPRVVVTPKVVVMPEVVVTPRVVVIPPLPKVPPIPPMAFAFVSSPDDKAVGSRHHGYRISYEGDSYALVSGDNRESMNLSGDIHTGDIDKARALAHGDFLWFAHDGKQYFVDDPATIAQIEAMYKPMEELGKEQEALGRQQEALGKQQEELGRQQEQISVPTPDMRKEMAEITEAMARLQAKLGKTITQEELSDLEGKLGDLQGRLGELQGQIGSRQGEFGSQQGQLGAQQGKLGAEQGRLGAQQGRLAMEADRKVHSVIEESLHNGKAHPVD
jgi:beta-lactamase regulating signal transducer with metallopeptidase domain